MHPLSVGGLPCVGCSRGHSLFRRPCRTLNNVSTSHLSHTALPLSLLNPYGRPVSSRSGSVVDPSGLRASSGPFLGPSLACWPVEGLPGPVLGPFLACRTVEVLSGCRGLVWPFSRFAPGLSLLWACLGLS